jgi:hypothetical protein
MEVTSEPPLKVVGSVAGLHWDVDVGLSRHARHAGPELGKQPGAETAGDTRA